MHHTHEESDFVGRFDRTWLRLRRTEISCGACWTTMVAAVLLGLLAAADYRWELPWAFRAVGLAGAGALVLAIAGLTIVGPLRWWNQPRTAAEVEKRFPELGQRVRTVVQYAGQEKEYATREGVMPALVAALVEDTDRRAEPLDLTVLVPRRRLQLAETLAALSVIVILVAIAVDWQWRTAVRRVLLAETPYTYLTLDPGDVLVDEDGKLTIALAVAGRVPEDPAIYCRPSDKPNGEAEELVTEFLQPADAEPLTSYFSARLENLKYPLEYWAVAGKIESPVYRISIRRPIAIRKFEIDLTPPPYTGLKPTTVPGGDLEIVEGTRVRFRVELDRPVVEAFLMLDDTGEKPLGMAIADKTLSLQLPFGTGTDYRIMAQADDGTRLRETSYRVRVRKDQPPRVTFSEPEEALEVHPIAEVLTKIRVDDDFGLTRAGIVFRVNSGDERTLILKDFHTGVGSEAIPQIVTQATLEETLRLEQTPLEQTDSISYYAFAEDSCPHADHRTETELRFIDIRPFRRVYKIGGT
ncbi:MAG: DUF4175 family protein [Pirellulaceae bacterium]